MIRSYYHTLCSRDFVYSDNLKDWSLGISLQYHFWCFSRVSGCYAWINQTVVTQSGAPGSVGMGPISHSSLQL